jgi:hypothetical protein
MKKILPFILIASLSVSSIVFAEDKISIVNRAIQKSGTELVCTTDDVDDGDTIDLRC